MGNVVVAGAAAPADESLMVVAPTELIFNVSRRLTYRPFQYPILFNINELDNDSARQFIGSTSG